MWDDILVGTGKWRFISGSLSKKVDVSQVNSTFNLFLGESKMTMVVSKEWRGRQVPSKGSKKQIKYLVKMIFVYFCVHYFQQSWVGEVGLKFIADFV